MTPIDYAPRDERSWLRRRRRMLAIALVAIVLAAIGRPAGRRVAAWVRWQADWRAVAALPAGVDPTLERSFSEGLYRGQFTSPRLPKPRHKALSALAESDGGSIGVIAELADIYVFLMRRPDGQRRIVAMGRPHFWRRLFGGTDIAILREPSFFADSAGVAFQSQAMSGNGVSSVNTCEMRLDPSNPSRLVLRIGSRPDEDGPIQTLALVGELTDEDRLRWRLTETTLAADEGIQLTPGEVFEFEDANGRVIKHVRESTVGEMLSKRRTSPSSISK